MSDEMLSSTRQNLSNSLPMPTRPSREREEPSMVFNRGKDIISLPKNSCEKSPKRDFFVYP